MNMRSQGCSIQQALTPEATAMVKQAVGLAKRRGHAQVTPLHVAHTMLSVSSGLFRAACLQSHSHPLQCRALELCFNVALNRLPTSTAGPMLGPSPVHLQPSIANALVAAFKRAQAHQRRGSIENQQQPLLAVKIELEQLIISILDDPSVSRVMKEAGFSSTLVKTKVEQAISMEHGSQNQAPNDNNNNSSAIIKPKDSTNHMVLKPRSTSDQGVKHEDVMSIIENLLNRRKRNSVVVGECIANLENVVRAVIDRVEKNEVPEGLKGLKFVHISLTSFGHLSKDEVEQRVEELRCLVKSLCVERNKGVILYLDDLKWANEFRANSNHNNSNSNILGEQYQPRRNYYCPIEHMIMEIGKLILGYAECGKLWLLGIATFQTYMRCKSGQPSLETIWGLHAVTIPAGSLALSLVPESDVNSLSPSKKLAEIGRNWLLLEGGSGIGTDSCRLGSSTLINMEGQSRQSSGCNSESKTSSLPSWLQQYKDENTKRTSYMNNDDQDPVPVKDLCKRWNSFCTSSIHLSQPPSSSPPSFDRSLSFTSISPCSSTSNFSYDQQPCSILQPAAHRNFELKSFLVNEPLHKQHERTFSTYIHEHTKDYMQQKHSHFISSNPNSTPTSTSSSDVMDQTESQCATPRFKEYNAENLNVIVSALEQKVPTQKGVIFDIASTVLHCRSGMSRRKGCDGVLKNNEHSSKEDTWLFFQGADVDSKEKVARELARLIFGSQSKFISIGISSFSSTRADASLEDSRNKRLRDEQSSSYIERFAEAISSDPHRVFFVEDIEQADYSSQIGFKKAIERGKLSKYSCEEEVSLGDAIIILSCESFRSRSRACSPSTKNKIDVPTHEDDHSEMEGVATKRDSLEETTSPSVSLDLNISIDDDNENGDGVAQSQPVDEIGLIASVDGCIVFRKNLEL